MARKRINLTLLRLSGWKARMANVIVGTPLFGFGGLLVLMAALGATGAGKVILFIVGGIPTIIGAILYRRALRGDDFTLSLGGSRSSGGDAS